MFFPLRKKYKSVCTFFYTEFHGDANKKILKTKVIHGIILLKNRLITKKATQQYNTLLKEVSSDISALLRIPFLRYTRVPF
jgi:hypothetical protein